MWSRYLIAVHYIYIADRSWWSFNRREPGGSKDQTKVLMKQHIELEELLYQWHSTSGTQPVALNQWYLFCRFVLMELLETEKDYVDDLSKIVDVRVLQLCMMLIASNSRLVNIWCALWRVIWRSWRQWCFLMISLARTRSCLATFTRYMIFTKSRCQFSLVCLSISYTVYLIICLFIRTFLPEIIRLTENTEGLGSLFKRYVSQSSGNFCDRFPAIHVCF